MRILKVRNARPGFVVWTRIRHFHLPKPRSLRYVHNSRCLPCLFTVATALLCLGKVTPHLLLALRLSPLRLLLTILKLGSLRPGPILILVGCELLPVAISRFARILPRMRWRRILLAAFDMKLVMVLAILATINVLRRLEPTCLTVVAMVTLGFMILLMVSGMP